MPWQLILFLFVLLSAFVGGIVLWPRVLSRAILTTALLLVAAFCAFGFAASFEYPGITPWKIGYATAGLTILASIGWIWYPRRSVGA